jgi:hypothetical protein
MIDWLDKEYKNVPGYWKYPVVAVKDIDHTNSQLELWYYVDNIRLEHDSRPR